MAKHLVGVDGGAYTWTPGGAGVGTVTLTGLSTLTLDQVLLITNVTDGEIIYNFADPDSTGSISSNVITLEKDTSSMSSGDVLQIWVDLPSSEFPNGVLLYDVNGVSALMDSTGRILTSSESPPAGPGETTKSASIRGELSAIVDDEYTIKSGKTLQIRKFVGGVENNGAGCAFTLFDDPNGDKSVLKVIPGGEIIIDGDTQQNDIVKELVGDGTRRLVMRIEQLTGGTYRTTASWTGVEF